MTAIEKIRAVIDSGIPDDAKVEIIRDVVKAGAWQIQMVPYAVPSIFPSIPSWPAWQPSTPWQTEITCGSGSLVQRSASAQGWQ